MNKSKRHVFLFEKFPHICDKIESHGKRILIPSVPSVCINYAQEALKVNLLLHKKLQFVTG